MKKMRIKKFNKIAAIKTIAYQNGYAAGYAKNPKLSGFNSEAWMQGFRKGWEDYNQRIWGLQNK